MLGSDLVPARPALGGRLPWRTPGGTDLRVFANDLLRPGRHRRDRLLLLRPWTTPGTSEDSGPRGRRSHRQRSAGCRHHLDSWRGGSLGPVTRLASGRPRGGSPVPREGVDVLAATRPNHPDHPELAVLSGGPGEGMAARVDRLTELRDGDMWAWLGAAPAELGGAGVGRRLRNRCPHATVSRPIQRGAGRRPGLAADRARPAAPGAGRDGDRRWRAGPAKACRNHQRRHSARIAAPIAALAFSAAA